MPPTGTTHPGGPRQMAATPTPLGGLRVLSSRNWPSPLLTTLNQESSLLRLDRPTRGVATSRRAR